MCGRFVRTFTVADLVDELGVSGANAEELPPNWNIPPTSHLHVVGYREGERVVRLMEWGLIPKWATDDKRQSSMINARVETAHEKPAFRNLVKSHRVVVPMSGFYEWDRQGANKVPYFFAPVGRSVLPVAGLWSSWSGGGEARSTVAILTTAANDDMAGIHDRMPCALEASQISGWLDPEIAALDVLGPLQHLAAGMLAHHRVSTRVNSVRNNGTDLIVPED